jgi:tetratricopeptide (TPR) repeat protein
MSVLGISAQTHSSANDLFQKGDYVEAQQAYAKLLKSYPTNALYLYRYARCAQEQGDYSTALKYFDKAGDRYMLKYFYLGEIYMELWQPDNAIAAYNTYLKSQNEQNERLEHIQAQMRYAQKLRRYLRRVEQLVVIDSVEVPFDSMLHVCQLSAEAGRLLLDSAHSLIYTNQRDDRRIQTAYIDSGSVIVSSHRLLDGWSAVDTLPQSVNFTKQQSSPYLLSDGVTLYFAANDTNGLGGLDLYVSRYNMTTESYTTPENLGMPYNSPANEYMFLLDELRGIAYLSTDRFAKAGRVHVYSFEIAEQKQYHSQTDSLVAYARLESFNRAIPEAVVHETSHVSLQPTDVIYFVLNDSVVYTSLSDFISSGAAEKYVEWQQLSGQMLQEQTDLVQLRAEYATAHDAKQKELASVILRLENNQSQLQAKCYDLLQEVRLAEIKARQSL